MYHIRRSSLSSILALFYYLMFLSIVLTSTILLCLVEILLFSSARYIHTYTYIGKKNDMKVTAICTKSQVLCEYEEKGHLPVNKIERGKYEIPKSCRGRNI
jgi:hypothetical protein